MKLFSRFLLSLLLVVLLIGTASAQLVGTGTLPKNILHNPRFDIYQRGVTAATISSSATAKYHADRWACFTGGASQAQTCTNITSGVPTGFLNAEQIKRTSGANTQTINIVQEVAQADMAPLQGQAVSLSCWMQAGAGLAVGAATANTVSVKITTGTSADEGVATFISGWTGAATPLSATQAITTTWARYGFGPVTIAAGANELGVSIGYTPTGTQQTNEFVNITGCQLEQSPQVTAFENRPIQYETNTVQRYFYGFKESATAINVRGVCAMSTTSIANCLIPFPVPMRVAPTMTYTAGFQASASTASSSATVCTALTTTATLTGNAASTTAVLVDCASSAGFGAAGTAGWLWDIGTGSATGVLSASADF